MLKMINQIEDIEYIERKNQWYLWYINNTGSLDNLVFQTQLDAEQFKNGFEFIAKSLSSDQDKFYFYEKTKLSTSLIEALIKLGESVENIKNTLEIFNLRQEVVIKLKK